MLKEVKFVFALVTRIPAKFETRSRPVTRLSVSIALTPVMSKASQPLPNGLSMVTADKRMSPPPRLSMAWSLLAATMSPGLAVSPISTRFIWRSVTLCALVNNTPSPVVYRIVPPEPLRALVPSPLTRKNPAVPVLASTIPLGAPLADTDWKLTPVFRMLTPSIVTGVPVVVVTTPPMPVTSRLPPLVAVNPSLAPVLRFIVPEKKNVVPALLSRKTP